MRTGEGKANHAEGFNVRVEVDGKQFAVGTERFPFRGVTYGTFAAREGDQALFPSRERLKEDFSRMREHGFTVVRTYTTPPEDVMDLASDWGLRVMAGVFYPDWRYLVGAGWRVQRRVLAEARDTVRMAARRLAGSEQTLALVLGNEIPADVLRWFGPDAISETLRELVQTVREEDPYLLVTYANYPTAEYLDVPELDFVTFNVFLEREEDLRRYLNRLHNLVGDRPLVLGEVGLDAGGTPDGEAHQAQVLDWQLKLAVERGVAGACVFSWTDEWNVGGSDVTDWHFGLTRADRSPRPALEVVKRWNHRTVADLDHPWPRLSVVICAYNAEAYIDECLRHTCALDYPDLEILVVDDGSTDNTAEIARTHPRARVLSIPHAGLSVARNEGFRAARGDLIAYLDSDAFPTPEWPYFLALGLHSHLVAGVGGPNVPPGDDPRGAHVVARAPGGPVHVLVSDDGAEHVPGCNMAFWRYALDEVGGFDPIYTSAGDDVDLCWKVLDRGWEIGFHPAALVWHRRRPTVRAYLKQQRGYGRAEALVEARHPDRFTSLGTARWRGRLYNSFTPRVTRPMIYRGMYGAAAFQSVYQGGGHLIDVLHQVGIPLSLLALLTLPLGLAHPLLALPAAVGVVVMAGLAAADAVRVQPPAGSVTSRATFRLSVAWLNMLQPAVRVWGRSGAGRSARRDLPPAPGLGGPAIPLGRSVLMLPLRTSREQFVADVVAHLRRDGRQPLPVSGWEDHDVRFVGSTTVLVELITSAYPEGHVQLRTRTRLRPAGIIGMLIGLATLGSLHSAAGMLVLLVILLELLRGWWAARTALEAVRAAAAHQPVNQRPAAHTAAPADAISDTTIELPEPVEQAS